MITTLYQVIYFAGDEHQIKFTDTSINDPEEMPGLQLIDIDGLDQHQIEPELWEYATRQMDPDTALTEEEMFRW